MDRAEDFLRQDYLPFVQKHGKELKQNVLEGLWNFTRDFPRPTAFTFSVLPRGVTWKEIQDAYTVLSKKEAPILKEQEKFERENPLDVLDKPAQEPYYTETSSIIRYFIRQQGKRSLEWLEENGRCCDHMRPGISTIPHAGRGAFATRDLPQGTIVGYSPLVHVGTHGMQLYNIPYKMGNGNNYNKSDLVLNYAFGHPNSTVLLSPYGSMVNYINHSPEPNVRIVWPTEEMMAHKPYWLERDIQELTHTFNKIGLSFDYVALRDIKEGEEITMDYGREWEQAWEDHVANWVPPRDAETYVHSSQWNETKLRTISEQSENPYPPNLVTLCYPAYIWNAERNAYLYMSLERNYTDRVRCKILERREHLKEPDVHPEVYTVELQKSDGPVVVLNVPRDGIYLTDRAMSQDWHLPNTFRHYIGIPDDIFPPKWKNKLLALSEGDDDEIVNQESTNPEEGY
jgi:SET domain